MGSNSLYRSYSAGCACSLWRRIGFVRRVHEGGDVLSITSRILVGDLAYSKSLWLLRVVATVGVRKEGNSRFADYIGFGHGL